MRKSIILIILSLIAVMSKAEGQKRDLLKSTKLNFFSSLYTNPATKRYSLETSYWEISSALETNSLHSLAQKGDKTELFRFNTQSFLLESDMLFYGDLSYNNSKISNVQWNESSDYELISPYIITSGKPGNVFFEDYRFKGGYSKLISKFNIGVEASYRANYQYRKVDPRPRNVVSEYNLKAGLTYSLEDKYIIGLSAEGGAYNQSNSISLMKKDSKDKFYMLIGLGKYDNMFSVSEEAVSSYYDIINKGLSLQFLPRDNKGFFAQIQYKSSSMEKDLADFNDINISDMQQSSYVGELAFVSDNDYQCKLYASLNTKLGSQNIYEHISSNNYSLATVYSKYSEENLIIASSHLIQFNNTKSIALDIAYKKDNTKYASDEAYLDLSSLRTSISTAIRIKSLSLGSSVSYKKNIDSKLKTSSLMTVPKINEELLIPNYNYLKSDILSLELEAYYTKSISNKDLFIQLTYKSENYDASMWASSIVLKCGINF